MMLKIRELTTQATMATDRAKISTSCHGCLSCELLIDLISELTPLIGHGIHLSGFWYAASIKAILLGAK